MRTVTGNAVDCLMGLIPMAAAQVGNPLSMKPSPDTVTAVTNSLAIIPTLAGFAKVQGVYAGQPHLRCFVSSSIAGIFSFNLIDRYNIDIR